MANDDRDPRQTNPMGHPPEQPVVDSRTGADGNPRFGRLLLVLLAAVMLIVAITFGSEAYFS